MAVEGKIEEIIEAKLADKEIDKSLYAFSSKYALPAIQVVKNLRLERNVDNIQIVKAKSCLSELFL